MKWFSNRRRVGVCISGKQLVKVPCIQRRSQDSGPCAASNEAARAKASSASGVAYKHEDSQRTENKAQPSVIVQPTLMEKSPGLNQAQLLGAAVAVLLLLAVVSVDVMPVCPGKTARCTESAGVTLAAVQAA